MRRATTDMSLSSRGGGGDDVRSLVGSSGSAIVNQHHHHQQQQQHQSTLNHEPIRRPPSPPRRFRSCDAIAMFAVLCFVCTYDCLLRSGFFDAPAPPEPVNDHSTQNNATNAAAVPLNLCIVLAAVGASVAARSGRSDGRPRAAGLGR